MEDRQPAGLLLEMLDGPDGAEVERWQREVAIAHQRLGGTLLSGEPSLALTHLHRAVSIHEGLQRLDPSNTDRQLDLVGARVALATGLLSGGSSQEAAATAQEALTGLAALEAVAPGDRRALVLEAEALLVLGQAQAEGGRRQDAVSSWNHACALLESLGAGSADPRVLDPLARVLILLGRSAEARPVVERLRAGGYRREGFEEMIEIRRRPIT